MNYFKEGSNNYMKKEFINKRFLSLNHLDNLKIYSRKVDNLNYINMNQINLKCPIPLRQINYSPLQKVIVNHRLVNLIRHLQGYHLQGYHLQGCYLPPLVAHFMLDSLHQAAQIQ